jgi:hypothetical protein
MGHAEKVSGNINDVFAATQARTTNVRIFEHAAVPWVRIAVLAGIATALAKPRASNYPVSGSHNSR